MLGHQFGQDLILGLHLLLQELDPFLLLLDLTGGAFLRLEGGRSVLEELFLPAVEHRRLQALFLTESGNRHLIQQMSSQNGYLLFRTVVLSFFLHAFLSVYINGRTLFSISS